MLPLNTILLEHSLYIKTEKKNSNLFLGKFSESVATVVLQLFVFFLGIFSNSLTTSPSASLASRKEPMDSLGMLAGELKALTKLSARMSGLDLVKPEQL